MSIKSPQKEIQRALMHYRNLTFMDFGSSLDQWVGVVTSLESSSSLSSSSYTRRVRETGREKRQQHVNTQLLDADVFWNKSWSVQEARSQLSLIVSSYWALDWVKKLSTARIHGSSLAFRNRSIFHSSANQCQFCGIQKDNQWQWVQEMDMGQMRRSPNPTSTFTLFAHSF